MSTREELAAAGKRKLEEFRARKKLQQQQPQPPPPPLQTEKRGEQISASPPSKSPAYSPRDPHTKQPFKYNDLLSAISGVSTEPAARPGDNGPPSSTSWTSPAVYVEMQYSQPQEGYDDGGSPPYPLGATPMTAIRSNAVKNLSAAANLSQRSSSENGADTSPPQRQKRLSLELPTDHDVAARLNAGQTAHTPTEETMKVSYLGEGGVESQDQDVHADGSTGAEEREYEEGEYEYEEEEYEEGDEAPEEYDGEDAERKNAEIFRDLLAAAEEAVAAGHGEALSEFFAHGQSLYPITEENTPRGSSVGDFLSRQNSYLSRQNSVIGGGGAVPLARQGAMVTPLHNTKFERLDSRGAVDGDALRESLKHFFDTTPIGSVENFNMALRRQTSVGSGVFGPGSGVFGGGAGAAGGGAKLPAGDFMAALSAALSKEPGFEASNPQTPTRDNHDAYRYEKSGSFDYYGSNTQSPMGPQGAPSTTPLLASRTNSGVHSRGDEEGGNAYGGAPGAGGAGGASGRPPLYGGYGSNLVSPSGAAPSSTPLFSSRANSLKSRADEESVSNKPYYSSTSSPTGPSGAPSTTPLLASRTNSGVHSRGDDDDGSLKERTAGSAEAKEYSGDVEGQKSQRRIGSSGGATPGGAAKQNAALSAAATAQAAALVAAAEARLVGHKPNSQTDTGSGKRTPTDVQAMMASADADELAFMVVRAEEQLEAEREESAGQLAEMEIRFRRETEGLRRQLEEVQADADSAQMQLRGLRSAVQIANEEKEVLERRMEDMIKVAREVEELRHVAAEGSWWKAECERLQAELHNDAEARMRIDDERQRSLTQLKQQVAELLGEKQTLARARDDMAAQLRLAESRRKEAEEEQLRAEDVSASLRAELDRLQATVATSDSLAGGDSSGLGGVGGGGGLGKGAIGGMSSMGSGAFSEELLAIQQDRDMAIAELQTANLDKEHEKRRADKLQAELDELSREVALIDMEVKKQAERVVELEFQLSATQSELAGIVAEVNGARAELDRRAQELAHWKSKAEEAEAAAAAALKEAESAKAALQAGVAPGMEALEELLRSAQAEEAAAKKKAEKLQKQCERLAAGQGKLLEEIDSQSLEIERLFNETAGLTAGLHETVAIANRWETQVQELMTQNAELRETISDLRSKLAAGGGGVGGGASSPGPHEINAAGTPDSGMSPAREQTAATSNGTWQESDTPKNPEERVAYLEDKVQSLTGQNAELTARLNKAMQIIGSLNRTYEPLLSDIESRLLVLKKESVSPRKTAVVAGA